MPLYALSSNDDVKFGIHHLKVFLVVKLRWTTIFGCIKCCSLYVIDLIQHWSMPKFVWVYTHTYLCMECTLYALSSKYEGHLEYTDLKVFPVKLRWTTIFGIKRSLYVIDGFSIGLCPSSNILFTHNLFVYGMYVVRSFLQMRVIWNTPT